VGLSTAELARLRADAEDYLPDTCTIQTVSRASDGLGGWTETWSNTYTGVACRLAPVQTAQGEIVEGEQVSALTRWILTVAHDQALDETMRVVHGGETYEVAHLEDTHSNRTAKRVYLRRLD
jgi:hypothetical protein